MNKFLKTTFRVLALPFVAGIAIVGSAYKIILILGNFLVYGGEWLTHVKGDEVGMYEIYKELKSNRSVE